jgi:hypothetical protein
MSWVSTSELPPKKFKCGYCNNIVASDKGYIENNEPAHIYICPFCMRPTYFDKTVHQTPGVVAGNDVANLPEEIDALYLEARTSFSVESYTASVLACRKLVMNIAAQQGAEGGKNFLYYVEYLAEKGYVPPQGKGWVDHIQKKGYDTTHEIALMYKSDAEELISFAEMLLKFIYEFPNKVPEA